MYQKYNIGEKSVKFYQKLKNTLLNISELEKLNMYLKSGHPDLIEEKEIIFWFLSFCFLSS